MKPTSDIRAKKVEEGIRIATDSMLSHLDYTHASKKYMIRGETTKFHKKCVQDYARLIHLLSELY